MAAARIFDTRPLKSNRNGSNHREIRFNWFNPTESIADSADFDSQTAHPKIWLTARISAFLFTRFCSNRLIKSKPPFPLPPLPPLLIPSLLLLLPVSIFGFLSKNEFEFTADTGWEDCADPIIPFWQTPFYRWNSILIWGIQVRFFFGSGWLRQLKATEEQRIQRQFESFGINRRRRWSFQLSEREGIDSRWCDKGEWLLIDYSID